MADSLEQHEVRRSLWDRLTGGDSAAARQQVATLPTQEGVRYLRESIQASLQKLLNSNVRFSLWAPALDELDQSLANYGLPDYTGTSMGTDADREHLRRSVERAVRNFEPRLTKVKVQLLESDHAVENTVCLRIDAEIATLTDPEPVTFRSDFDPLVRRIAVSVDNR